MAHAGEWQSAGQDGARRGWLSPAALSVGLGVYAFLMVMGNELLNDPDTYWQVVLGRWMMLNHAVPRVDNFSFTFEGQPWISSQWLAQVLYASAERAFGWSGVVVLAAAAGALTFGLLTQFLFRRLPLLPCAVLLAAAFALTAPHLVARPHMLALPVMVAWTARLLDAVERDRPPPFALLPLMTLWANLHGGFTFGLALLGPIALEALVRAEPHARIGVFMRWFVFGLLALAAACVTPYGPESILVTLRILGLGGALHVIGEWRPQDFGTLTGFAVCLLAGLGLALHRGIRLPPIRLLMLVGLLWMALSHVRNAELLGLLAPLFLALPLADQTRGDKSSRKAESSGRKARYAPAALAGIALLATLALAGSGHYRPSAKMNPEHAVAAIRAAGKERIFNNYDFGGYLIYAGLKPFIDGRTELYGTQFVLRHNAAVNLQDVGGLLDLLDRHAIDAILLRPEDPATGLMDRMPGWQKIHADDVAVAFVRGNESPEISLR